MDDPGRRFEERLESSFDQLWDEFRELRLDLRARNCRLVRAGWAFVGVLIVQLVVAVIVLS